MTLWLVVAFAAGALIGAACMFWWLSSIVSGDR